MDTRAEPPVTASNRSARWRSAGYWLATAVVAGELGLGGSGIQRGSRSSPTW